jgi:hypothetical protein
LLFSPSPLLPFSPSALVSLCLCVFVFNGWALRCEAGEELRDPAAETTALKDLQALLERMGADVTEQPQERVEILQALARVREALDSWPSSVAYYDALVLSRPNAHLCGIVFSGAWRARVARDGNLAGVRAYFDKDALEATAKSDDMTKAVHHLQGQLARISGHLTATGAKAAPNLRPMPGVRFDKDEEKSFWKVMPPPWLNPPPPPKRPPNQPASPQPATGIRVPGDLAANPALPNLGPRIRFIPVVTPVQPAMLKRIVLIPEEPPKK